MWWHFKNGKPKGKLRIERIQVAWYDMEHNGDCYELQVRKLTKKQQRECTNFYGGR